MSDSDLHDVAVVIVSFNTRELLRECIETLYRGAADLSLQVIVVDNASGDGSADMVASAFPDIVLIRSDKNLGFGPANNRGFDVARARYVVLLNSDAFVDAESLPRAVARMEAEPDTGLAGGRLVGREGEWQPSARLFPSLVNEFLTISGLSARFPGSRFFGRVDRTWADQDLDADVDWVPGAFTIIRSDALARVGVFDERFFLYYEEVDLCRRIKAAGYGIRYWPEVRVVHIGGESSRTLTRLSFSGKGNQLTLWRMRSQALYYRKHHGLIGAWSTMQLESSWHRLRGLRNRLSGSADAAAKAEESAVTVELWKQAWRETDRGRRSPPQPW
jgi:GT2 family glycosyltransferase